MAEEKFKARLVRDLDSEEKEGFEKIEDYWNNHPIIKNYHGKWREYIAFFEGDQYLFYNEVSDALEDITPFLDREVYTVCNRILPMVRQIWGEVRYRHQFKVDPNTVESEDVKAAKLGSMLIEFLNNKTKFHNKLSLAKLWALIVGDCYWKIWWNKNLQGMTMNEDREAVKEGGDIDQDLVIPFNFRPDPEVVGRENWRFVEEGKRVPISSLAEEFDIDPKSINPDPKNKADSGLFERTDMEKTKEDTVIRIEYHERPSKKYSTGIFMVKAGNYLCYRGENPSPDHDIPYFDLPGILPILGEDQHDSIVRVGQSSQRQLNRMASYIDGHIDNYHLKAMIPRGSLEGQELKAFTRSGMDFVEFNPLGAGTPFWQQPPPIPPFVMDWFGFHEKEIEAEMSVREVSLGRLPKYSTRASGVLFEGLKGQDEKVLLPGVEEQDQALCGAMAFMLRLAIKHYSLPRMVKITGRNQRTSVQAIKGADLRNNTDVIVTSGVDLFTNKEQKQEVVMTFVEKDLITDKRQALQLMDMKGMDEFMEDEFIDERQAYRENDMMREGKVYPMPSEDDNNEVHFKIHNDERKKEDFDLWPDKGKDMLTKHIEQTKEFLKPPPVPQAEVPAPAPEVAPGMAIAPMAAGMPLAGAEPAPAQTPEELIALAEMLAQAQAGGGVPPGGGI